MYPNSCSTRHLRYKLRWDEILEASTTARKEYGFDAKQYKAKEDFILRNHQQKFF